MRPPCVSFSISQYDVLMSPCRRPERGRVSALHKRFIKRRTPSLGILEIVSTSLSFPSSPFSARFFVLPATPSSRPSPLLHPLRSFTALIAYSLSFTLHILFKITLYKSELVWL
jgi:hypothetical protein